ncbi:hypothetical protein [Odoribacter laneus]|uniref:hypothetical protein n=1 Tax=Odoribacter laneus TaxID=626933 RepID=UPI0002DB78F0|nr:hypothetical protein [Odoribacter laneus]
MRKRNKGLFPILPMACSASSRIRQWKPSPLPYYNKGATANEESIFYGGIDVATPDKCYIVVPQAASFEKSIVL